MQLKYGAYIYKLTSLKFYWVLRELTTLSFCPSLNKAEKITN